MQVNVVFFDIGDTLIFSPTDWVPGAKAALSSLKSKHVRLGIISNTGTFTQAQLLPQLPADFDWNDFEPALVLLSFEVGIIKPDPAIFSLAVQRSGVEATECLFCTEDLEHTLVAQSIGMITARVQKPPQSDIDKLIVALTASGLLP